MDTVKKRIIDTLKNTALEIDNHVNNQTFLTKSNIKNRLVPELVYAKFDFNSTGSELFKIAMFGEGLGDIQYTNNIFSKNCVDISFPGTGLSFVEQNIFNTIKTFNTGVDASNKNMLTVKIVEDSSLIMSKFIEEILYESSNPSERYIKFYPNDYKFMIYVIPLNTNRKINNYSNVVVFDNCMFNSFNDWDFDMSGTKTEVQTKVVTIRYERKFITDTTGTSFYLN